LIGVEDDMPLAATNTFVVAQGPGEEVGKMSASTPSERLSIEFLMLEASIWKDTTTRRDEVACHGIASINISKEMSFEKGR
jgi:hypothetical protein